MYTLNFSESSYIKTPANELAICRSADLRKVRLGRYPFTSGIKYYIARKGASLASSTLAESEKKLRKMGREFEELKRNNLVRTTDPRHIGRAEIDAYLIMLKKKGLQSNTRSRYVQILNGYLMMFGNNIINEMKAQDGRILPPKTDPQIVALSLEELQAIFDAGDSVEGHRGTIIRGVMALAFSTGIRPKEFILAEYRDLDVRGKRFFVRHPKGEESWGSQQWVPIIRGDMIPRLERFLIERERMIEEYGVSSKYLFFNPRTGEPYTLNTIRTMKKGVEKGSGVRFSLKDFRSSLASQTIMGDLSRLKPVSLQLRHANLATTERYYARIYHGEIESAIGDVWKDRSIRRRQ